MIRRSREWGDPEVSEVVTLVADSAPLGWREALTQRIKGHAFFVKRLSDLTLGNWHLLLLRDRAGLALDIGCGFGSLTLGLGEYYSSALGVDMLRERLAYASLRAQQDHRDRSRFTQTNAHQLPLRNGTCDLVTMNGVLECAALYARGEPRILQRAMLLEARRVLKPDGVIAVAIENRYALEELAGMADTHTGLRFVTTLPRVVANGVSRARSGRPYTTYLHSRTGYKTLLRDAGFADVCIFDLISSYNDYDFIVSPDDDATYRFLWRRNVVRTFVPWAGRARRLLATVRPRWLGRFNYAYLLLAGNRVATPLDPAHELWGAGRAWGVEPGRARFACRCAVSGAIAIVAHDGERVTGIVEYGNSPELAVREASASPSLVMRQLAGEVTLTGRGEVCGLMARAYRPRQALLPGITVSSYSPLSRVWWWTDGVLHPLRRRRALVRLRRHGAPKSIVFVCHGNICRSPYAAAAFARRLPQAFSSVVCVESAGFILPGRPAPLTAVKVARRRGLDLSVHRSTLVGPVGRIGSSLVVVMEAGQGRAIQTLFARDARDIVVLGGLDPEPIATRAIEDPVEQPEAVFERSYARIDRCVKQLARSLFGEAGRG